MTSIDSQPFLREFEESPVKATLSDKGFFLFETRVDGEICADLRKRIDRMSEEEGTEVNYAGSEHRNWQAATRDAAFAPIETISNKVMPKLYGRPSKAFDVLAIRNRPAPPEAERFDVRWHLDSFRKQLKLFVFLTDVGDENGPLEYVPGTHTPLFKYSNALLLGYYQLKDLMPENRGKRSWQRIHDRKIEKVRRMGFAPKALTVPAGTVALVDTSGLHRARPCLEGERYAVSTYHH